MEGISTIRQFHNFSDHSMQQRSFEFWGVVQGARLEKELIVLASYEDDSESEKKWSITTKLF